MMSRPKRVKKRFLEKEMSRERGAKRKRFPGKPGQEKAGSKGKTVALKGLSKEREVKKKSGSVEKA